MKEQEELQNSIQKFWLDPEIAPELKQWDVNTRNRLIQCLGQPDMLDLLLLITNLDPKAGLKTKALVEKFEQKLGNLSVIPEADFSKENLPTLLNGLRVCKKIEEKTLKVRDEAARNFHRVSDTSNYPKEFLDALDTAIKNLPRFYRYAELLFLVCNNSDIYFHLTILERISKALGKNVSFEFFKCTPNDRKELLPERTQDPFSGFNFYGLLFPDDGIDNTAVFYDKIKLIEKNPQIISQLYQGGWFRDINPVIIMQDILALSDINSAYMVAKTALGLDKGSPESMLYFVKYLQNHPNHTAVMDALNQGLLDLKQYFLSKFSGDPEKLNNLTGFLKNISNDFLYELFVEKNTELYGEILLELQKYFVRQNDRKNSKTVHNLIISTFEKTSPYISKASAERASEIGALLINMEDGEEKTETARRMVASRRCRRGR